MGRIVRIPVRVVRPVEERTMPDVTMATPPPTNHRDVDEDLAAKVQAVKAEPAAVPPEPKALSQDEAMDWCDRALRLQAEMENYRKRQQRLAQDQIEAERKRLLRAFLGVVDDLERALEAPAGDGEGLRRGVQLTHRAALQLLGKEGVERVRAEDQPFDPVWQEAVSTVAHQRVDATPDTVVQVLEPGYRLGDQLLRPAKVVVAV